MRIVLLVLFLMTFLVLNAQSKKEQIQILSTRLDSLKAVQSSENLSYIKRKTELESSISNYDERSSELLNTLSTKKENLQNQILENKELEKDILALKLELKSIEDSIQKILDDQPIKFLESSLINKSDEEIILLMNIRDIDLGTEFIKEWEPNRKPEYSILGKQFFELQGKNYCLVIAGVQNPNDYHGAYGTNFITLFQIENSYWLMKNEPFNTNGPSFGGWGNPALFIGVYKTGEFSLAVELEGGFTGSGCCSTGYRKIVVFNNGIISNAYEEYKHDNDGLLLKTTYDYEYDISFQKSTSSKYYDLIETKKNFGKKIKTTIFKFNENTMKYE